MAEDIKIEGLEALLQGFKDMAQTKELYNAFGNACAVVERAAREKAPKGSGELRRSITSKVQEGAEGFEGVIYTPLEYAPYIEFGTGLFAENGNGRSEVPWVYIEGSTSKPSNSKTVYNSLADAEQAAAYLREKKGLDARITYGRHPQPFLRPALDENREEVLRKLKEGIKK